MPRLLVFIVLALIIGYSLLCLGLYLYQRSLLYFPQARSFSAAEHTQTMRTADGNLVITAKPIASDTAVIYFGGNAEDVSTSLAGLASGFPQQALYLPHYRGFGGSDGKPSEIALHADALALYDKVRQQHRNIILIGRSLGTGIAIRLASLREVSRLVLVTPYDSIEGLASQQFPYVPVSWLLTDKFESWRYAPSITVPTSIILAEDDEVVPRASSQQLVARFAPGIATTQVILGTGHNTILESPQYTQALQSVR